MRRRNASGTVVGRSGASPHQYFADSPIRTCHPIELPNYKAAPLRSLGMRRRGFEDEDNDDNDYGRLNFPFPNRFTMTTPEMAIAPQRRESQVGNSPNQIQAMPSVKFVERASLPPPLRYAAAGARPWRAKEHRSAHLISLSALRRDPILFRCEDPTHRLLCAILNLGYNGLASEARSRA